MMSDGDHGVNGAGFCAQCGGRNDWQLVEQRSRPVCTGCHAVSYLDPKLAVGVLVTKNGRLLLGRRAEGAREAGRWSFPAGFVERGETVEAAAVRETREETGLEVDLDELVGVYSESGETVVLIVYAGSLVGGSEQADDDLDMLGWFEPSELPELAFPRDYRIIAAWFAEHGDKRESAEPRG